MFLQRTIQVGRSSAATVMLTLILMPVGFCQSISVQDEALPPPDEIEEIVVYGEKSMTQLRLELHRAEDNFFTTYNTLNSNREFDVRCDYIVPIETRRRQHVCTPIFALRLQEQAAQDMVRQNMQNPIAPLGALLSKKEKLMWKEMAALVAERPELKAAYAKLVNANRSMDAERQKRCDERGILCKK